jgi:hypothetical protein
VEHRHTKGADEVAAYEVDEVDEVDGVAYVVDEVDEVDVVDDEVKEWMVPASEFVNMSVVSSSGSGILPRACRIRLSKQQPK